MTHEERASAVLELAIRESVKGREAASGALIRGRVESCLSTALARCKEDPDQMHEMIDEARELPTKDTAKEYRDPLTGGLINAVHDALTEQDCDHRWRHDVQQLTTKPNTCLLCGTEKGTNCSAGVPQRDDGSENE